MDSVAPSRGLMRTVSRAKEAGPVSRLATQSKPRVLRAESSMSSARLLEASLATWEIRSTPGVRSQYAVFKISMLHWHFDINELYVCSQRETQAASLRVYHPAPASSLSRQPLTCLTSSVPVPRITAMSGLSSVASRSSSRCTPR